MTDHPYDTTLAGGGHETTAAAGSSNRRDALQWLIFFLLFVMIAIVALAIWNWSDALTQSALVLIGFATLASAVLAMLPALLCVVQNASRRRQHNKLMNLLGLPVAKTAFFKSAVNAIDSIRQVVDRDYSFPIFLLSFITFLGFMTIAFGFSHKGYFSTPVVILGGLHDASKPAFADYQFGTFAVISMAFIGSYIYAIGRLLDRINNNDLYPVSLYYYITRMITACAVAAVLRHTITLLTAATDAVAPSQVSSDAQPLLILLGFAIGFAPDQFILVGSFYSLEAQLFDPERIWRENEDSYWVRFGLTARSSKARACTGVGRATRTTGPALPIARVA